MRKVTIACSTVLLLFCFSGCRKIYDHLHPGNGNGHGQDNKCRISQLYSGEHSYLLYYNDHGDPDSITTGTGDQTSVSLSFTYDSLHRLSGYSTYWGNIHPDNIRTVSTYTYRPAGTVFEYLKNYMLAYEETGHLYSFDSQGRVVHETKTLEFSGPGDPPYTEEIDYVYNAEGNRIAPEEFPGISFNYDNKKNIYRTSEVWQFIAKQYSKNNPQPATQYNSTGLPLSYAEPYRFLFSLSTSRVEIPVDSVVYDCGKR